MGIFKIDFIGVFQRGWRGCLRVFGSLQGEVASIEVFRVQRHRVYDLLVGLANQTVVPDFRDTRPTDAQWW